MASQKLRNFYFDLLQTRLGLFLSKLLRSWNFVKFSLRQFTNKIRAIWNSREFVNYTYDLSDYSREYLPYFISNLIGCSVIETKRVIQELEQDHELAKYHFNAIESSYRRWSSDPALKSGRLLLHYAIVRLTKPRLVFEAGLDKGVGAIILNRALQRNRDEGFEADYIGVEFRADRPAFIIENFSDRIGKVRYSSWSDVFQNLAPGSVDFLFYDAVAFSDELEKFVTFSDQFSKNSISICAWSFEALYEIAARRDLLVSIFPAFAKDHWFDGNLLCVMHKKNSEPLRFQ